MKIKIKYKEPDLQHLEFIEGEKSDWVDLYSAEDVELKAGEYRQICLGVAIELPSGYEAYIAPRSSTFKNFGILQVNSIGVVDESYRGDNNYWMFPVLATRDTKIKKGDRICQFRIMKKQERIEFITVDHLDGEDRGSFGSTGIN